MRKSGEIQSMALKKILTDETKRELEKHGTDEFPMTIHHDNMWAFEGKSVSVHWHNDLEIGLPKDGELIYQVYQKSYSVRPGEAILLNRNVPHSCHSPGNKQVRYSSILVRPDFLYGEIGSDVEKNCFRPFLENAAVPCILFKYEKKYEKEIIDRLNQVEQLFDQKPFCFELGIKGILCEIFARIIVESRKEVPEFVASNQLELERLEQMLGYIHEHYDSGISLQQMAEQIHLSREGCCRLFKKMTGKTITGYLGEYRLGKSLQLVQSGQYSITQVAEMNGFSNASRFASAFRKRFGYNPGEYNRFNNVSGKIETV